MMKKLLLLSSALLVFSFGANAQVTKQRLSPNGSIDKPVGGPALKTASTPTVVVDTLHYYFNKYYFKTLTNDAANKTDFPFFMSPAATGTAVTHCGSKFEVPAGDTVIVNGLEAFVAYRPSSLAPSVKVHLFLCNLDGNSKPILPPVDSVITTVGAGALTPSLVGGNFTHTTTASPNTPTLTPRTMTANFAVLFRNMSTIEGDTVHLLRTNGATYTNMAANPEQRSSDTDFGYVRFLGQFYSTKDFSLATGFGPGTDYEFMVAPRVTYTLEASTLFPANVISEFDTTSPIDTLCTRTVLTFTNTSSKFFEHRQYNLNQFYRKWNLYSEFKAQPKNPEGFSSDSTFTWTFEFYANAGKDERVFLPYANSGTISAVTDLPSTPFCYDANAFRARLRPMSAYGRVSQIKYNEAFKVCMKFCNGDALGVESLNGMEELRVYPNPALNGKTTIYGLEGKNTIIVYDMLGQIITNETTENATTVIDLTRQPKGTYVMRIRNSQNASRVLKIVNQN